jgi:hypothetical protein
MIFHKTTLPFVLAVSLTALNSTVAQETPNGSLQLTMVAVHSTSSLPLFRVELHNQGDHPFVLNLGFMMANGKKQYPDAIRLSLKDSSGKILPLELIGPAINAGRTDPLIVPLPEGATFVLPIDLQNYYSPKAHIWKLNLSRGQYKLNAEYEGRAVTQQQEPNLDMEGIVLMPYWTGAIHSNTLPFTLSKNKGKQQGQPSASHRRG